MDSNVNVLELPAQIDNLETVTDTLGEWLEEQGFTMRAITQMAIATEEIFVNICHYAYEGAEGLARIERKMVGDTAEVRFIDTGVPFNPLDTPEPDIALPAEDRAIGGLGIHMVRSLVSSASYQYADGQNILLITKKKEND